MHEGTLAESILKTAIASMPDKMSKITRINLVVGRLSGIVEDSLMLFFNELSKNTPAEGAKVRIKWEDAQLICKKCGNTAKYDTISPLRIKCEKCGAENTLEGGQGNFVESIEVENENKS